MRMTLTQLTLCVFSLIWLTTGMPVNPMTPIVANSEEVVRFLWDEVQHGRIYKTLPPPYTMYQGDWNTFLYSRGQDVVYNFFGPRKNYNRGDLMHQARREFIGLVKGEEQFSAILFEDGPNPRKRVSERLVQEFAERQQRLRASLAARRQEWGRDLSLGIESKRPRS